MKLKVLLFILLFSSISAFAQSKEDAALKTLIGQMTEAQQNYKPDALDKLLTADYIEISPVGEFDPREKVLGFYKPELKPPADKMSAKVSTDEFSIRVYDKLAVVIVRLNYEITSEGKPLPPRSIRATFVCKKDGKDWKIASAQYTGIRQAQPPKS
ncbi:MAG TPA: nuclear transport factor 2 family protein [Pyrinomonadaceae bacterium]|nr:nuclear transport factor 2 family protein [Pyrinomonadaceae bacterium]